MRISLLIAAVIAATLTVSSKGAFGAVLTEWGAEARTSTRSGTNVQFGPVDGGPLAKSAASSISNFVGDGRAEATLPDGPSISIPELKAEAISSGERVQSLATGIEGYTYTGAAPKSFSLSSTLTASVLDPNNDRTGVEAQIYLFGEDDFFFTFSLATLVFESGALVIDSVDLSIEQTESNAVRMGTLDFTLDPGESVYLWTQLSALGLDGGSADAFGTLTSTFEDSAGLVAASQEMTVIPEPTAPLFLCGSVALIGLRRRRR
jgi:hypothetical protein